MRGKGLRLSSRGGSLSGRRERGVESVGLVVHGMGVYDYGRLNVMVQQMDYLSELTNVRRLRIVRVHVQSKILDRYQGTLFQLISFWRVVRCVCNVQSSNNRLSIAILNSSYHEDHHSVVASSHGDV